MENPLAYLRDDECPYIQRKLAGDETYDICEINGKPCLIEHRLYECEIWNEIRADCTNDIK